MVKKKKDDAPEILWPDPFSYNAGFVGLRFVATDETSGEAITVPGVWARFRLDMIDAYHSGEPGTLVVYQRGQSEPAAVIGTVPELDAIFKRHQLFVMAGSKDKDE